MRKLTVLIGLMIASAPPAWAAIVRHGGEWQTVIDNGQPLIACFPDATLDQDYVTRTMAKLPGANCKISNIATMGNTTSYSMSCTIGGSLMTTTGTFTQTGPDAFMSKVHSHGGMIKMPDGKTVAFPDTDTVTVQHRLGACKPGDRQINH